VPSAEAQLQTRNKGLDAGLKASSTQNPNALEFSAAREVVP
jgi:hypothetical protein